MRNISITCNDHPHCKDNIKLPIGWLAKAKLVKVASAIIVLTICSFGLSAKAQTATLLATNQNVFVGANFNGIYTNSQLRAALSGTGASPVTLSVAGAPAGVTILFSTNAYVTASNPLAISNSWNLWYSVAVTNVAKGIYPLTFTCSGAASASTVVNLIVGTLWTSSVQVGSATDVPWSTGANWSTGVTPGSGDAVIFQDAGNTNNVTSSVSINSLTFIPVGTGTNQNMLIAPGQTLSVVGTNGFAVNNDSVTANNKTYTLNIYGPGGSLVVTNSRADFTINGDNTGAAGSTVIMTNLDNFSATVNRFGLGDWTMAKQGGVGAQFVSVSFAKTNVITAKFTGDYALTNFTPKFSMSMLQNGDPFNNGSANVVNLGISNAIFAESLGFALNRSGGNPQSLKFNPVFTNIAVASMPYVSFRNTNGGRMNLVGVGVDSGTSGPGSNCRGVLNFSGGIVDMLVDTMWLGRDRTGSVATNTGAVALGVLTFTAGTIDVNYLRAGYQAYTNNSPAQGQINVGGSAATTAVLNVNTNLELGYTTGDFSATPGSLAATGFGQIVIFTNGIVRANQITVGQFPGQLSQNRITINAGGTLDVTNTVADPAHLLTQLINNGGTNVLHMNGSSTLIYCSNVTAAAGSKISIASVAGAVLNTPIPVISFVSGTTPNNFGWSGVAPFGINVVIGTSANSVNVTLSTGTPKTLRWVGNVNNTWDTSTLNWQDTATSLSTNFATGDQVIFDDTASQFSINVAGDILPSQAGVGIAMTNTTPYTFTTSSSGRLLGGASLIKQGTGSLTVDLYTELAASLSQGSVTTTAAGTIGSIIGSAGTAFANGGTVLGNMTSAGMAVNAGNIIGVLTAKTSGFVTNAATGTVSGGLATESGSFVYNAGTFTGIGTATIVSNATFINAGTIANGGNNAGSLAVNGTFKDMGVAAGTILNLNALVINGGGTFIPGGDGIGTTTVTGDGTGLDGRVQFLTGSTNIFKVDMNSSPSNTLVTCAYIAFGPSQGTLVQNGGTLLITNIGIPAFASGQSFQLVGNNFGGAPFDSGLNTTNSLSIILPSVPAIGLAWDLSQLIHGGIVAIKTIPTAGTNLVFNVTSTYTVSTNVPPITNSVIVTELSWPANYIGWKLQQQQTTLDVGLSTNWTQIVAAQFTNDIFLTNAITPGAIFYRMISP
jgi:hypothetical protein